jgi:hypothetical protein
MQSGKASVYMAALLVFCFVVSLKGNLAFAAAVDLPKTGQTTCYDSVGDVVPCEGTGQDGELQVGVEWPVPRFTDNGNGNGTITDNLTGLTWLKDANCFGTYHIRTDALNAVADLNANPGSYTCGGYTATYDDWVLPNINELEPVLITLDHALAPFQPPSEVQRWTDVLR